MKMMMTKEQNKKEKYLLLETLKSFNSMLENYCNKVAVFLLTPTFGKVVITLELASENKLIFF